MKGGLAIGLLSPSDAARGCGDRRCLCCRLRRGKCLRRDARRGRCLLHLKERFGIDYLASLILEPQLPLAGKEFMLYNGSIGKVLPVIVAKESLPTAASRSRGSTLPT